MRIKGLFRKKEDKNWSFVDPTEERFQKLVNLVWDLDKKEFNKLMEALKFVWQGYDKIRTVQTNEEKEAEAVGEDDLGDFLEEKTSK